MGPSSTLGRRRPADLTPGLVVRSTILSRSLACPWCNTPYIVEPNVCQNTSYSLWETQIHPIHGRFSFSLAPCIGTHKSAGWPWPKFARNGAHARFGSPCSFHQTSNLSSTPVPSVPDLGRPWCRVGAPSGTGYLPSTCVNGHTFRTRTCLKFEVERKSV